jgi:hypothetical protein
MDVRGTPTIIVNGWRVPSVQAIESVIDSIRAGKTPFALYTTRDLRKSRAD